MNSVRDLSILVAGASGGLGAPISRLLAADGARLTLLGRDRGRLEALGLEAALVTGDLRAAETAVHAVAAALEAHGRLDALIVASGVVAFGPVGELTDEVLVDLFAVNTLAPIRLLRAALPALTASAAAGRAPFVLHLSAIVAEHPAAGMAAYSASKGALTAFDAAAGRELRRAGIRLIDARPPHTETGLADRPIAGTAPRLAQGLDPDAVAARVLAAVVGDERDLPSAAFA
ncbi:SDR family NAD(P)-dependent oxidoreductase [Pengzhenrongella phosphoraccumulans]|uniref:SDR family NAD(P)-dependent oxidoreductase n=1 Tax=Pengzhenrongella phosphoraccumulans TaxID=3114394 RepID=UPI003890AA9A